jgi:hypothetical protein
MVRLIVAVKEEIGTIKKSHEVTTGVNVPSHHGGAVDKWPSWTLEVGVIVAVIRTKQLYGWQENAIEIPTLEKATPDAVVTSGLTDSVTVQPSGKPPMLKPTPLIPDASGPAEMAT